MRYEGQTTERLSRLMSKIKSTNTMPENMFGKLLWTNGFRYRKHQSKLPGKPDFSLAKYRIAIFVDGEFWHGFNWEARKKQMKSNLEYWIPKIEGNIERDKKVNALLGNCGWKVVRCWESEVKKKPQECLKKVIDLTKENSND